MNNEIIRQADDLAWCLVSTDGEISTKEFFVQSKTPLLIIHSAEKNKTINKVEIYTHDNKKECIKSLAKISLKGISTKIDDNTDNDSCKPYLTASIDAKSSPKTIQQYLNEIFSLLLITGRPLRYYNCTFFLPLDLILDSEIKMASNKAKIEFRENEKVEQYKVISPSSLLDLEKSKKTEDNISHAQAYEYFHTHIQEQLFETEKQSPDKNDNGAVTPITHHRIKHEIVQNLTLNLQDKNKTTSAQIEDVSMYQYYNGLYVLGIRVGLPQNKHHQDMNNVCWVAEVDINDKHYAEYKQKKDLQKKYRKNDPFFDLICSDNRWWEVLVFGSDEEWGKLQNLQVEHWLRYTKLVRVLYANFYEQLTEQKIAPVELHNNQGKCLSSNVCDPFSSIAIYFINEFLDIDDKELQRNKRLKQLADERMFVHASYVLAGIPPKPETVAQEEFERLFSYALYVDQHTDGYERAKGWAYDKTYIKELMETQVIKRWQSISNLSGYTDYSTIFMGFTGYFQHPTTTVHVPYIYAKMQIQILFYRLTLEHFDRRITQATKKLMKSGVKSKDFSQLRRSLISFTNQYWFRDMTPQIQGKEIAIQMMKQQELTEKYDLLKDKLGKASEYTTTLKDFWLQEKAVFIGWIAIFLAVLAFFPALFESYFNSNKQLTGITIVVAFFIATTLLVFWKLLRSLYKLIKRKVVKDECTRK